MLIPHEHENNWLSLKKMYTSKETCLYQSSLGEFLVDLRLIHDTLGSVSIVQSAQSFLK